jgi:hypothetical protein
MDGRAKPKAKAMPRPRGYVEGRQHSGKAAKGKAASGKGDEDIAAEGKGQGKGKGKDKCDDTGKPYPYQLYPVVLPRVRGSVAAMMGVGKGYGKASDTGNEGKGLGRQEWVRGSTPCRLHGSCRCREKEKDPLAQDDSSPTAQ